MAETPEKSPELEVGEERVALLFDQLDQGFAQILQLMQGLTDAEQAVLHNVMRQGLSIRLVMSALGALTPDTAMLQGTSISLVQHLMDLRQDIEREQNRGMKPKGKRH